MDATEAVSHPWLLSVFGAIFLVLVWVSYFNKEKVTWQGGSPEFITGLATVTSLALIVLGIVGEFSPVVLVQAKAVLKTLSTIQYLGGLAILGVGLLAATYYGEIKVRVSIVSLLVIAVLVWLYLRFGVEISVGSGPPTA